MARGIRVALLGSGYIAAYHARAIAALEGAELAVVAGPDEGQLREFAATHGVGAVTTDVGATMHRDDIDAVVLATPNRHHAEQAIESLRHGKDVLIEKPMARSAEEGLAIADAERSTGQLVMVGHMWRFDAEVRFVRELIAAGRLGRVVKTTGYGVHENWGPSGWFTDAELAGGGALVDMGVHAIDTARFLLGDARATRVYARVETRFGDYPVDDAGTLMIEWDGGVTSIVESGWWFPHAEGPEAATRVMGTRGYASIFPTRAKLVPRPGGPVEWIEPELPERSEHCDQVMYTRQMERFLACIRRRTTPVPGTRDGLDVLRIVDAAYRASREGRVIEP